MKACVSTKGRRKPELIDNLINDPFLNDYTKIIQSRAYRRLSAKTQVFASPDQPHVRTRAIHTDEVVAVSITISEQLGLNTNLCMAIAAGHDIGHTPYGHSGERILSELTGKVFKHAVNGIVVAQDVEREGKGLNLSFETLEGILYHSRGDKGLKVDKSKLQEYSVVMFADKIAYLFSDLNDAVRFGYLSADNLPESALFLGNNQRERTNKTIEALVTESKNNGYVQFSEGDVFNNFHNLKSFMYNNVYLSTEEGVQKIVLTRLYEFFSQKEFAGINPALLISLMTDKEADYFCSILKRKPRIEDIKNFGVTEIIPSLVGKEINYTYSSLKWGEDREQNIIVKI